MDVQDFINGGEVNVKTLDEEEIVVEGRVERKVGNTRSTKSFKRTFIFSDMVPESITSVVSADGILIIKALKKVGNNVELGFPSVVSVFVCASVFLWHENIERMAMMIGKAQYLS